MYSGNDDSDSPVVGTDLKALRADIAQQRRRLDERERALDVVEQMERERTARNVGSLSGPRQTMAALANGLQVKTLSVPEGGITEAVKFAINTLYTASGVEFCVPDIEVFLGQVGYELPKIEPRSRIAMVLQGLRERGLIVRTFEGSGRAPHRYKVKHVGQAL